MNFSKEIFELIERFNRNREAYISGQYNETQLRREFIDPFFELLGWDVNNKQGYAEVYKDVIHEDAIKIGSATKAPDYCFRIGGTRKFFVEAKKPSVNLKDDVSSAFQLRRYAWSAKLPLSILTDFEEFAVYDCRITPVKTDKASTARILYLTYKDYAEKWDEIASIFSREAILKGSFDKYAETGKHKRGTAEVDSAFLKEIELWRDMLARNIALRNPELTQRELNFAVQRTIDRIIFLRICEDRGVEEYGRLMSLMNGANVYRRLLEIFRHADEKYNSGLFHFQKEKERHELPDELTPILAIDDKHLKDIIKRLYYPESPYEFSVLPADILGQVYEQFLGKVIRLTSGHRAIVEEKPEVRKAGGVYYTPTYIVDYIVKNTVGKLLGSDINNPSSLLPLTPPSPLNLRGERGELSCGVTPKDVSKIRILDPACGSGSFLLGAYQYLLDWHCDWYINDSKEKWATGKNPSLYQAQGGDWHLTTSEKKRILLNNIYGVDIDSQAVEVTKLSLLLKVLEGENNQTIEKQLKFYHERALPDLGDNIKCGNSLIGPDFYQQQTMLDDEERYRINVFDWEKEFSGIMKSGGFDAVIGNPPYGAEYTHEIRHFLSKKYNIQIPITDSFVLFILKAPQLLKNSGLQAYIVPSTWLYMPTYIDFRKTLLSKYKIIEIVHFRKSVFQDATVETCIELLSKEVSKESTIEFKEVFSEPELFQGKEARVKQKSILNTDESNLCLSSVGVEDELFKKLANKCTPLGEIALVVCGLTPYRLGKGNPAQTKDIVEKRAFDADHKKDDTYRQYVMGRDFFRYTWQIQARRWISYGDWLAEPRYKAPFNDPLKIIIRQTADSIIAHLDNKQIVNFKNVHNLRVVSKDISYHYLLGLLNSRLITWWYQCLIPEKGRAFAEVKVVNLKKLPIRPINFSNPADKARHDKMVFLVEQMLSLNKKLTSAKTDHEKTALQRQIEATDRQIDKLVYELYGVSEEEIGIVEGSLH